MILKDEFKGHVDQKIIFQWQIRVIELLDIFNDSIKNRLKTQDIKQKKNEETTYRKRKYIYTCSRCKKKIMTSHLMFIDWTHPFGDAPKSFEESGEVINEILSKFKEKIEQHEQKCKNGGK